MAEFSVSTEGDSLLVVRDQLRRLRSSGAVHRPATVYIRGGTYRLEEPLCFDHRDSGPTTYTAAKGEAVILDGGLRITNWSVSTANGVRCWMADVGDVLQRLRRGGSDSTGVFRSLFVNGHRRPRARWPKQGFAYPEAVPGLPEKEQLFPGTDRMVLPEGLIDPAWRNLTDIDLRILHLWIDERMPLLHYNPASRLFISTHTSVAAVRPGEKGWLRGRLFVENVFEAMTRPGEWYVDRREGRLYYLPCDGETPDSTEVVVPMTLQLLRLDGAQHLRFVGLTFRHVDWVQPAGDWRKWFDPYTPREQWRPRDSFDHFIANDRLDPSQTYASVPQAAFNVPGAIRLMNASHCAVEDCRIELIGGYGIELGEGCRSNRIVGNHIRECGAGGISIDGANIGSAAARFTHSNRVTDNRIDTCGRVFYAACGIWLGHTYDNTIAHNELIHLRYTGISLGWQWTRDPHISRGNIVEKNHIHHIGGDEVLSDLAGIYTLGIQPGTTLRGNVIHDIGCDAYGAWGIYCDASSSNIITEDNLIYATGSECLNNNTGNNENLHRNNILIASPGKAAVGCARRLSDWPTDPRPGSAMTFIRSIIITRGGSAFRFRPGQSPQQITQMRMIHSEANLLWDADASNAPIPVKDWDGNTLFTWSTWRETGHDRTSLAADPLLLDGHRLSPDSPALKIGFTPTDLTDVGPRRRGTGVPHVQKQPTEQP